MGWFGPTLPIDADELEWQLATFKWLTDEFGAVGDTKLVLPTSEFFPKIDAAADRRVALLFDQVRSAAGMEQWACELVAGDAERPIHAGNAQLLVHHDAPPPCGTFRIEGEGDDARAIITYNPNLAGNEEALVATFAHELGHYLLCTASTPPPGGIDLLELATDLGAVYLGFGIFLANSARNFRQFQSAGEMGWASQLQGYLSEAALVTATAIFQRLAGREPAAAAPHLKPYLQKVLKAADSALAKRHPDMAASVAAVDLSEFAAD